jgi:1-acyl-sn-glycerol-3-phosphate acyltransferase
MKNKYTIFIIIFILIFFKFTYIGKKIVSILDFLIFIIVFQIKAFIYNFKNKNIYQLSKNSLDKLNLKLKKINKIKVSKNTNTIYLFNHRSWGDFFIDHYICKGTFIGRKEVKYILPFTSALGKKHDDVIFFDRSNKKSKYKLYDDIKKILKKKSILLYPEGTRNTSTHSKPLKFGIIKLGYEQNVPFQIIIVNNKENVMNEKKLKINKNIICEYFTSELIYPKDFKTLKDFTNEIQKKWDESWNNIYKNNV